MKQIIQMAWRNIWRNKLRSAVIILSVGIGILSGIFVMALYKGMMRSRVRILIDSEVSHVQMHHPKFKLDQDVSYNLSNDNPILSHLQNEPLVKSFCIRTVAVGMIASAYGSAGVQIVGIDDSKEKIVSSLDKKIIIGKGFSKKRNEIIIGKKLCQKLKLNLGKKIVLTFTDKESNLVSGAFRICGIYETVNTPIDERYIYVESAEINELLGLKNQFHEIAVILHDDDSLSVFTKKYQAAFPNLKLETWKDLSPESNLMVNTVDTYSFIIMVIILLALSFGIINTMLMAILERTKEIAMMTALGLNKFRLFFLIMLETLFLTIMGSPIGLLISYSLISYLKINGINFSGSGNEMMRSFGFESIIYPQFPNEKILPILLLVTSTALLSSILPAIKAMKLLPSEGLRK